MVVVGVDDSSLQADLWPKWVGFLAQYELSELLQWLCHDDSIMIIAINYDYCHNF